MVWFALFLFIASFVLTAVLTPKPDLESARPGKLGDIRFPRAESGAPIPLVYGKVRMRGPNTLWYGWFQALAIKKTVKTGLFSSEQVTTGYNYAVSMDLGLCTGPDVTLHRIWVDKKILWSGTLNGDGVSALIAKGDIFGGPERGGGMSGTVRFYSGGFTQTPNAYLQGILGTVPGYNGLSHIVFENLTATVRLPFGLDPISINTSFYIGNSPTLRPTSYEISRYPDNLGLVGDLLIGDDLNPMEILYDLLTSKWGGRGVDPSLLDVPSFLSVGATLKAEGNGASMMIMSPNDVRGVAEELLRQIDGLLYQEPTTGKIKVRLIREDYSIPALPVFDETNVRSITNFARTSWSDTTNRVRVLYNSRVAKYNQRAAMVEDFANIETQGRVNGTVISFPGVTVESLATDLGTRELSQLSVPLFRVTLEATREASSLVPGDPFVLNWTKYGLSTVVMRVQRFDFGELLNGRIVLECLQDKFSVATTLYSPPEDTGWVPEDRTPVDITDFRIMESPRYFVDKLATPFAVTPNSSYLWGLARNPGFMEGYDLETSTDVFVNEIVTALNRVDFPLSCQLVGDVYDCMGQSDGILNKIVVTLPQPDGAIFHTGDAASLRTTGTGLICVNGEIMGYETFTDNLDGTYDLNNVHRALLDTQWEDHVIGDAVYLLTGVDWLSQNAENDIDFIWYQFLSFSDQGAQSTGDAPTNQIITAERYDKPIPPDLVEIEGVRAPIEVIGVVDVDITNFNERNIDSPVGQVVLLNDSSDVPPVGTTYNLRLYIDGALIDSDTAAAGPSFPLTLNGLVRSGVARVEVESVLATKISWTPEFVEFFFGVYLSLSAELVSNGDFESAFPGAWSVVSGAWADTITVWPLDPIRTVGATTDNEHGEATGATNELSQTVDVIAHQGRAALFRVWKGGKTVATGQVIVELLDNVAAILDTITTPLVAASQVGKWELLEIPIPIRTDCDDVRIRLLAPAADSVWDNVSLKANTVSPTSATEYDTVAGVTVEGAWGLRIMDSGYSGALVRLRDTFDDTEFDVGADPDGNLEPFYVRGQARVVRLYDQSGNAAHLEAEFQVEQPRLHWMLSETGRPGIRFENNEALRDTVASTTRPYMVARPNCLFAVGPKDTAANSYILTIPEDDTGHLTPFGRWGMTTGATDWRSYLNGALTIDPGNGASNSGKNTWWLDYQNGLSYHNEDVTSVASWTAANVTYPNNTRLRLAETPSGSLDWRGEFFELCIFSGNISAANRKTLMEAVALYWYNQAI